MPDLADELSAQTDAIEEICHHSIALARDLEPAAWDLPTDCPGWSVRDHLAHMVGLEQVLDGAPMPEVELPPFHHVTSDLDRYMEIPVHARRCLPMTNVADEFDGMLGRRLANLRARIAGGDPETPAPMGSTRPLSRGLPIRVFDLWTHEQDMRRATGRPMRLDGVAGPIVAERILVLVAAALPHRAEGVDATVRFTITGPTDREVAVALGDADRASIGIAGDLGIVARLACGRGDVDQLLASATITGDTTALDALKPHLALTP